jgi:polyisoprenoid-binding protein YceI
MGVFMILSFALLGVAAFVIQRRQSFNQVDALHLLFVSALAVLLKLDFDDTQAASVWTYSLIGLLAVNFLLSRWSMLRKPLIRLIPPLVSFGVLLGVFWNDSFVYLGDNFNISDKATFALPILGIIAFEAARLTTQLLNRYFGTKETTINILLVLFLAIAAIIGIFNAQGYGVFLVAVGFAAASFYNETGSKHILHSLLAVSLVWTFAQANSLEMVDLRFAKVVGGLFIGGFVTLVIRQVWTVEKRKNLALFLAYGVVAMVLIGILDVQLRFHPAFGGVEALLSALLGLAVANAVLYYRENRLDTHQAPIVMSVLSLMILITIIFPPLYVNEEAEELLESLEVMTETTEQGEEAVEVSYISFEGLSGKYDIVSEESVISFKLGPAGSVTKGAIKDFSGNFNFAEDLTNTTFDVKLPVINLTTFISMRDNSIMGADYFNEPKFPLMRFKGSKLKVNAGEDGYEMIGNFEMLGVKKEQTVMLHRVEEEGKIVLVGNGSIDRRDFGMADDPREGNVVDFEFKVELKN